MDEELSLTTLWGTLIDYISQIETFTDAFRICKYICRVMVNESFVSSRISLFNLMKESNSISNFSIILVF